MISSDLIFNPKISFEDKTFRIFDFQKENNPVYKRFCKGLGVSDPESFSEIPLLPIQAFKEKEVLTAKKKLTADSYQLFLSSGTSGMTRSKHIVTNPKIYQRSIIEGMKQFYDLDNFVIWAYTPGYAENPDSSLIYMLDFLIKEDKSEGSRFLNLNEPLNKNKIDEIEKSGKRLMIFGAAFGLLDLIEISDVKLPEGSIIIETGGMKTFRREMTKEDLHNFLSKGFGLPKENIHSEYGMTELLSQAYSTGDNWFKCVPWMNVSIRNPDNPMEEVSHGSEGLIGVIDLANINSCSFILTGDKGIKRSDGKFQVLGRWNPENLRGCNFLIDQD